MKTTFQRRSVSLAGLLLLSLLVLATGIQAAQAALAAGTGAGSGTAATPTTTQDGWLTAATTAARNQDVADAVTATTTTQDGWLTAADTAARNRGDVAAVFVPASGAQPASADTSSTTTWIAVGSVAAVLLVGFAAWTLIRRRGQPDAPASAAYCAQHPGDPRCMAV